MRDSAADDEFLDLIYETAIDASLWPALLQRFAGMLGGHAAALRSYEIISESGIVVASGLDSLDLDAHIRDFASRSPLKPGPERLAQIKREGSPEWRPGTKRDVDWLPKDQFVRTEYYNDFYKTFDIHSDLSIGLSFDRDRWTGVDVYRPERHGAFTSADLAVCDRFHPHLVRALRLARRLSDERCVGEGLAEVFDRSPHGLFLLDRDGCVRHVNQAGLSLIAQAGGLRVTGGRLGAPNSDATRRLQGLIFEAATPDLQGRTGGSMALLVPDRALPLSIMVAPLRAEHSMPFLAGPAVIVCVTDLAAGLSLPEERLRELFGLTIAESRVASALFEGFEPSQAAKRLGLALPTVRTHLARIFAKTGAANQVELARLMMRTLGSAIV